MLIYCALLGCLMAAEATETSDDGGTISGVVVNMSRGNAAAADAEVILRAELNGEFVPVAATRTDERGRFVFTGVPLDLEMTYLPGANLDGVHYPGPRLVLGPRRSSATVNLTVRETMAEPNPLIIRQQEIVLQADTGALHVTEALLVDNPTSRTYVGRPVVEDQEAVTFNLGVPPDFERLTFEKEVFGRSFSVIDGRLVTSRPWEPGRTWLRFTYTLRNEQAYRRWERRLDLPCEELRVRVRNGISNEVQCNLPSSRDGAAGECAFQSVGRKLPDGHLVRVELGRLPVPWMAYARWAAVLVLAGSVVLSAVILSRKRAARGPSRAGDTTTAVPPPHFSVKRTRPPRRHPKRRTR